MPWKEVSTMSQRKEFIVLAMQPARNVRALCRAFSISPKTGYKWLARYAAEGEPGLQARSCGGRQMPQRTDAALEHAILHLRTAHPAWGGRKLHARLQALGYPAVPSAEHHVPPILRSGCTGRLAFPPNAPAAPRPGSANRTQPRPMPCDANGFQRPFPSASAPEGHIPETPTLNHLG